MEGQKAKFGHQVAPKFLVNLGVQMVSGKCLDVNGGCPEDVSTQ